MTDAHPIDDLCNVCGLSQDLAYGRNSVRIVAESPAMQQVLRRVARIAPTDAGVLLTGESGTGKEVVARAVHDASLRRTKRFVAINCAALPPDLLESELFGHARGAFTGASGARRGLFEEAHGGTLFLDEIGDLPAGLQAKLLRVLQEGEVRRVGENENVIVDVRIIAATNSDLPSQVAKKLFREDLYYRLKVFSLELPPLRLRQGDVLPMARAFLSAERAGLRFSARAEAVLLAWHWPGNVRELRNAVRHGAVLAEGSLVEAHDLPPEILRAPAPPASAAIPAAPPHAVPPHAASPHMAQPNTAVPNTAVPNTAVPNTAVPNTTQQQTATPGPAAPGPADIMAPPLYAEQPARAPWPPAPQSDHHLAAFPPLTPLDEVVRAHVRAAIDASDGNRAAAARALGVGRNTLWRWLKGGRGACNRGTADDEA